MVKRMIHDALFANEELSDLAIEARYLYIAMIVHADDAGRMRADPKFLKLKAFPFDNHSTDKILLWRNQLASSKIQLITLYTCDGKEYLFHPKWGKWQTIRKDRMKPTDCPEPINILQPDDNHVATKRQPMVDISPPNLTYPNLTKPNLSKPSHQEFDFEKIWQSYPKREGRKDAEKHFRSTVKTVQDYLDIQNALEKYKRKLHFEKTEFKFIKMGSTWFNNWRDYIDYREVKPHGTYGGTSISEQVAQRQREEEAESLRRTSSANRPISTGLRDMSNVLAIAKNITRDGNKGDGNSLDTFQEKDPLADADARE